MRSLLVVSALASLAQLTSAQAPLWGQCGGIGWTGATTCVSGACCQAQNPYYSQCLQGNCGGNPVTTTPAVTTTSRAPGTTPGTTTTSASGSGATVRSPGCGRAATISSGTRSITVNGQNRQYIIRVPNNYDSNKPYKLIFSIHWRGGNMQNAASGNNYYGLVPLAGENAIFISPQGFDAGWANNNGQDVTFFDAMIAQVEAGLCVNQRQRFATGFSWGGGMSFSLACSRATVFRAVSVIAGGQISGCSGGNDPIAYLGIHGLRDNVLSISGGRTLRDRFVRNNGCTSQSPPEPAQGSLSHRKTAYSGCRAGYPVVWIASDSGHVSAPADGTTGDGSNTFAPKETWDFFNQFT